MVKIAISDKVYISGLTSEQKYELAKMLTIPNPAYHKAIARGQRWTKLPPAFKYLEHTGFDSYLCAVPIGCLRDVIKLVGEHTIDDRRVGVKRDTSYSKIKLRDYQEKIIEDIGNKEIGIIHAGVGVGKTITGLHLASQVVANGGKVCITTIRTNLVEQFAIECERFLGIKPNIVPAKRKADKNPDSPITIASVSTLQSMKEEHRHLFKSDMFIIDEAHAMMTEKREKLIMSIKSKYRYAMTGTLNNEYGKSDVLGWIFGGVVAEYKMTMIKPTVKVVSTGFRFHSEDYHEIAAELAECGERNKLIVKAVQNTEHNRAIILVKRVEHAKALQASLSEVGISSVQLDGKSSQEEREEALRGSGSKSAIIGSFGLLGTGINVPELDLLVLAGDIKSKNLSLQSCGRVLRLHEGKTGATVIDMWDEFSGILRTHGLNRMRSYREMDWKVSKLKL